MCQSVNMSAGRQKRESGPVWSSTGNRFKSVFTNPIICINYSLHSLCCLQDLTSSTVGNIHSRSVGVEVALNQGGEELCSADPSRHHRCSRGSSRCDRHIMPCITVDGEKRSSDSWALSCLKKSYQQSHCGDI